MLDTQRNLKARAFQFDAPVNSVAYHAGSPAFAFGLGDGRVHIVAGENRRTVQAHAGAVPVLRGYDDGFLSLSDDGTLAYTALDADPAPFADFKGAWTEKMAVHDNGSVAVAVGRHVHLWTRREAEPTLLGPHDSTVNDIHFAADGMGLAAAHRDGVTLWAWPHYEPAPMRLGWKGAHLAVTVSRDKRWIVTGMQEGALHLWNVALKKDFQMQGYWGKPTQLAWSADRKWLGTSGAETVVLWPFDRGGPEGREAIQLGWSNGGLVTALAAHPEHNIMAAGFEDGAVILIDIAGRKAFAASAPAGSPVTAAAFAPDGDSLLAALANGGAVHFNFLT